MHVHFKEDWNCIVNSCFLFSETVHCLLISHKGLIFSVAVESLYVYTGFLSNGTPWRFPYQGLLFTKKLLNQTISSQDFSNQISYLTHVPKLCINMPFIPSPDVRWQRVISGVLSSLKKDHVKLLVHKSGKYDSIGGHSQKVMPFEMENNLSLYNLKLKNLSVVLIFQFWGTSPSIQ